jgi:hypothetical protein
LAAIIDPRFAAAFPNADRWVEWETYADWPFVPTSTSAEEFVKREGKGPNGFWRSGSWET